MLLPECRENEGLVPPEKQTCKKFYAGCGDFLEKEGHEHVIVDCDTHSFENPEPICPAQSLVPTTVDTIATFPPVPTTREATTREAKSCSIACEPITISECTSLSYSTTGFPNFFNNTDQTAAAEIAKNIDIAVATHCSEKTTEFLCGLLVPECRENEGLVLPNRQMCKDFYGGDFGCKYLLEVSGNANLIYDCDVYFSENPEPTCSAIAQTIPVVPKTEEPTTMSTIDSEGGQYLKELYIHCAALCFILLVYKTGLFMCVLSPSGT